jgi:SAM-dependent methyltransferase
VNSVDRKAHWDDVYRSKSTENLTWYQARPETSLRLIESAGLDTDARIVDVGGGTSTLVDCLLDAGYRHLGILDVSPAVLQRAQQRLGARGDSVELLEADVTRFEPPHSWDLWHDRAVLHFLTAKDDVAAYRRSMLDALAPAGQAVVATFGPEGPLKCSGLEVRRYDPGSLSDALGPQMELVESVVEEHVTPKDSTQQFLFCRFRRIEQ